MCETRDRSHKRMLNSSFPALYGDQIGHTFEGDTEVRPDRGSDQQVQDQETRIDLGASNQLGARTNVGDRHCVHNVVDQPDKFPSPITLSKVPVSFEKGVRGTSLMHY